MKRSVPQPYKAGAALAKLVLHRGAWMAEPSGGGLAAAAGEGQQTAGESTMEAPDEEKILAEEPVVSSELDEEVRCDICEELVGGWAGKKSRSGVKQCVIF